MIYFDNASTTALHPEIQTSYTKILSQYFINSESLYDGGMEVNRLMEKSRSQIAEAFHTLSEEIYFTSGASEANNTIIKGIAFANQSKGKHIITTSIEHSSVLGACRQLSEYFGFEITYLPVNHEGVIRIEDLISSLRKDTILVSIMYVNNEVGSIQPIEEIKEIVKTHSQALLHVDCVQALGKLDINLKDIDCASFSAHKIEGLKGSGIMMKKRHVAMLPLISAGQQERGLRGGTSNALVNILFAKTLRLAMDTQALRRIQVKKLNTYFKKQLTQFDCIQMNSSIHALDSIINFSCLPIPSEIMMNALNASGICVSAQSTCESKSHDPSYVLQAMGIPHSIALCSVRCSFSIHNTLEEIDYFISTLKEIINHYGKNSI